MFPSRQKVAVSVDINLFSEQNRYILSFSKHDSFPYAFRPFLVLRFLFGFSCSHPFSSFCLAFPVESCKEGGEILRES